MKIKWLFLFVLLAMPVCVYLFLQSFGENHFAIPIFYENGLEFQNQDCASGAKPFLAQPISVIDSIIEPKWENDKVVVYGLALDLSQSKLRNNLLSFLNKYKSDMRLSLILIHSDSLAGEALTGNYSFLEQAVMDNQLIKEYGRCVLQLKLDTANSGGSEFANQLVLCDQKRRIRGYYDVSELEEIDRLNTELDILLNK